jgi:putative oxidoreductase
MAHRLLSTGQATRAILAIRIIVGFVFVTEGIQKFLFPDALGVGRFIKIGIPAPELTAPFVGVVEIVFGLLILIGLFTRLSAIPLMIDMVVAIATTKIPFLLEHGFWPAAHESRVDLSMLFCLAFLLSAGPGKWSLDWRRLYKGR